MLDVLKTWLVARVLRRFLYLKTTCKSRGLSSERPMQLPKVSCPLLLLQEGAHGWHRLESSVSFSSKGGRCPFGAQSERLSSFLLKAVGSQWRFHAMACANSGKQGRMWSWEALRPSFH